MTGKSMSRERADRPGMVTEPRITAVGVVPMPLNALFCTVWIGLNAGLLIRAKQQVDRTTRSSAQVGLRT